MKIHPDAEIFPLVTEAELAELARDIAAHGLREAIKTDHTGEWLVDGRNRQRACELAGIEPRYEPLPSGTDIFAYIVSINLHRRHLTDAQRREIIRRVAERNPTLSNRQIAKLAKVSYQTVNNVVHRPDDKDLSPVQRKTGGDGKSYPASGKFSEEEKTKHLVIIKAHPEMGGRELAEFVGISHGSVQRYRRVLEGRAPRLDRPAALAVPSLADRLAKRHAAVPRYDNMSREERGMGTPEEGAQQHPDYPPGWTYDDAHREKYGRIQLYTPSQQEERNLARRFTEMVGHLAHLVDGPAPDELDGLSDPRSREPIVFQVRKLAPKAIDKLNDLLEKLAGEPVADETKVG